MAVGSDAKIGSGEDEVTHAIAQVTNGAEVRLGSVKLESLPTRQLDCRVVFPSLPKGPRALNGRN